MILHTPIRKKESTPGYVFFPVLPVIQSAKWTCSAAATSHGLKCIGIEAGEWEIVNLLGPSKINPWNGLEKGNGDDLVSLLREHYGLDAYNKWITFHEACQLAGHQPMLLGGVGWNHWTSTVGKDHNESQLYIANPAPGHMEIWNRLNFTDWNRLGSWASVIVRI